MQVVVRVVFHCRGDEAAAFAVELRTLQGGDRPMLEAFRTGELAVVNRDLERRPIAGYTVQRPYGRLLRNGEYGERRRRPDIDRTGLDPIRQSWNLMLQKRDQLLLEIRHFGTRLKFLFTNFSTAAANSSPKIATVRSEFSV